MDKANVNYKVDKIIINNFDKTDLRSCEETDSAKCVKIYNFKNCQGVLKNGMSIRNLMLYESNDLNSLHYEMDYSVLGLEYINKVMYFKQYFSNSNTTTHRLLIHGSDGKLYLFQLFANLLSPSWMYGLQFETIPAVLAYKKDNLDSILISANDKLVVWTTGKSPYELTDVPTITSMCVYNDVLYCTISGESDKIWYTSNLDPESVGVESDQTQYLTMTVEGGGGQKILLLNENIYVFCEYGIGRINTYAKKEPTYNQIYFSHSKICANTVVLCGDFVVFMTRDGLYRFNGSSVDRIDSLQGLLIGSFNDNAVATVLNDNYYLATKIDFEDNFDEGNNSYVNNALIKLNLYDYSFEVMRGVDIKDMLSLKAGVEEKIVLTFNSDKQNLIGELVEDGRGLNFNDAMPCCYCTNYIVQDDAERVTIRKVVADVAKDMTIQIITENSTINLESYCDEVNEFQVIIPCNKFKIQVLSSTGNGYIKSIEIQYVKKTK